MGMICAAMGIDRADQGGIRQVNKGVSSLIVGVMQPGKRVVDYHTVGGGYPSKSERVPVKADHKTHSPAQTRREFITGGKFGIIIEAENGLLERIGGALERPRWGIWFGRKSCVPAAPIWRGVFSTEEQAWCQLKQIYADSTGHKLERAVRVIREVDSFDEGSDTIRDVPVDFSSGHRTFMPRRIAAGTIEME
jgi:CRISPR system Cascade subunit CasD